MPLATRQPNFASALSSREVTPSSSKEASFDATVHDANEGTKGGKKRRKQHPQRVMAAASYDGGNDEEAGDSGVGHVTTAAHSGKCQARPPIDHLERLLVEVCPNHSYPVMHKLKDCDIMKNFMILGSLTRGMELDEDPVRSDMMPFPGVDTVMTLHDGRPPPRRRRVSNLSLGTLTHCGWGPRNTGV
jgi:hypothetical protein